jgi:hypothetical protein
VNGESKWMVGFCSAEAGNVVKRYFLVDGAADGAEAHRSAMWQAELEAERAGVSGGAGTELDLRRARVRQIVPDPLGGFGLSDPLDGMEVCGSSTIPSVR